MARMMATAAALILLGAAPAMAQQNRMAAAPAAVPTFSCWTHLDLIENWQQTHKQPTGQGAFDDKTYDISREMQARAADFCAAGHRDLAMERINYVRKVWNMPPNTEAGQDVARSMDRIHRNQVAETPRPQAGSMQYPFTWPYN